MIPKHATLDGSLGIKAGLGRDRIDLDLSSIPADALTVAIRGDNGMGKSTLLNLALVPWREPPHINGAIYDQFGPQGMRELIWTHAGQEYWSRIEYKNTGKTRTQKATLKIKRDGAWEPVTLADHTVSDGKASTYDACLAAILGPQSLYYLSAFRAQGAAPLAAHTDPKGLMRALLSLDEPAALAEQAKDQARELKRQHETVRDQARDIDAAQARIEELETWAASVDAQIPALADAKLAAIQAAGVARADLDRALAGDIDRQHMAQQRADAVARVDRERQALATVRARWDRDQANANAAILDLDRDIQAAQSRALQAIATLRRRDAIRAAEAEAARLAGEVATQEQATDALLDNARALSDLAGQIKTLEARKEHVASDGKACAARLKDLQARAGFVAVVPCKGAGEYATCPALQDAQAAEGRIPDEQAAIQAKRAEWHALEGRLATLTAQAATLQDAPAQYAEATRLLTALRARLDAVRADAAGAAALEIAERNRAEANAAVADLEARLTAARQSRQAAFETARQEIDAAQAAFVAAYAALAALPEPGTDAAIVQARQALQEAESGAQAAQAALDTATAMLAQYRAEMDGLRRAREQGQAIIDRASQLESEIAEWTLLAKGLQGVIDLSIEDAGPGIASLANRLLTDAYGPRFSVRIVTQRQQQNGVVRECFDISVIDADSGLESSILSKSGGESVWLDKALTDAVALYHQEAAGQHYECLFADEADGALSVEKRHAFLQMDRAALRLGGYQRKYFISHSPEAWAMADHVIDLAEYK